VRLPELLAPAGNIASFYSAIEAGADAVYIGLKKFSARNRAENFTIDDFKKAVKFAHIRGKKVYAAINTIIKESEIDELVDSVAELQDCRTDAIIFADPLFMALKNRINIPLHASTQMHISNSYEAEIFKQIGIDRVILERQLEYDEIVSIRKTTDVDLELFVDGALCYSISGLCFFSSFLGGKSANRGLCTQVCRRNFRAGRKSGSIFSMSDLMTIRILDKIVDTGIDCIKIEGRMKSSEAIFEVTMGYRNALDDIKNGNFNPTKDYFDRFIGHRSSTTRLFLEKGSKNIIDNGTSFVGRKIGHISDINIKNSALKIDGELKNGDRLRISIDGGNKNVTFRWWSGKVHNGYISIKRDSISKLRKGMPVFLNSSIRSTEFESISNALFKDIEVCKPIDLEIEINNAAINIKLPLYDINYAYHVDIEPSKNSIKEFLYKYLGRLGSSGYQLNSIKLSGLENVFIRPSVLNKIRRDLLARILDRKKINFDEKKLQKKRAVFPGKLFILTDDSMLLSFLKHKESVISSAAALNRRDRIIFMPKSPVLFENQIKNIPKFIKTAYVTDLSWLAPLKDAKYKIAGYAVYAYNHISFNFLTDYFDLITLFIESSHDDLKRISEKIDTDKALIYLYGKPDLFTSRVIQKVASVKSSRDEEFELKNNPLTFVRPSKPFSWIGHRKELEKLGYRNFMLDLRTLSTAKAKNVIKSYYEDKAIQDSYTFNWNISIE